MAIKPDYIIRQGEPLSLALLALEGDISPVVAVEAHLKDAGINGTPPSPSAPILASFVVTVAPQPDVGWMLDIPQSITSTLEPGFYMTNAKLTLSSGGPLKTDHLIIQVKGSVT